MIQGKVGITPVIGIVSTSFQRRIYALLTSLTCAGLMACNPNDSSYSGKSPDPFYSTEPDRLELAEDNAEVRRGKNHSDSVILEGALGPEPARPRLGRSLVSGSATHEGSDSFVREQGQVLFGSDASASDDAEVLPAENAASPQNPITESGK